MILLIDNYDSFSYNLYQMIGVIEPDITVIKNDEKTIPEIEAMKPDALILSPGPGKPSESGICEEAVLLFSGKIPVLGVCLGHQAICEAFGATVSYAAHLMHGKQSVTTLDTGCPLFHGCPDVTPVARYHSLAVLKDTIPDGLTVTATADDGEIMGIQVRNTHTYGVQFHPESIMTPYGGEMLRNFIDTAYRTRV